ncbi:MAG: YdcF family protein [Myxococcales bacterium]|nr:YdcF family protein [Myxococcales bacterium]
MRHLAVSLFTPPGVFVALLLGLGVLLLRRKPRWPGAAALGIALASWALAVPPVADSLLRGLEAPYEGIPVPEGDVVIVLGGGVRTGVQDLSGTGAPSYATLYRAVTGFRLQRRLKVPLIVSGGRVFETMAAEAPIAKRLLEDLGAPAEGVLAEDQSRDTLENARESARLCKERGFRSPVVVTSAFHLTRALSAFRKVGLEVHPYPADFLTWTGKRYGLVDFLPNAGAQRDSFVAIREYLALMALAAGG